MVFYAQIYALGQGLINYVTTKVKCRHLKILACKGTWRQVSAELSFFFPFLETPNTVAPYPMPVRHSLCNFQWRQSLCYVKQKDQLELCVPLAIRFIITLTKVAEKNLRAYKDISNETICSQINLAAQAPLIVETSNLAYL